MTRKHWTPLIVRLAVPPAFLLFAWTAYQIDFTLPAGWLGRSAAILVDPITLIVALIAGILAKRRWWLVLVAVVVTPLYQAVVMSEAARYGGPDVQLFDILRFFVVLYVAELAFTIREMTKRPPATVVEAIGGT